MNVVQHALVSWLYQLLYFTKSAHHCLPWTRSLQGTSNSPAFIIKYLIKAIALATGSLKEKKDA